MDDTLTYRIVLVSYLIGLGRNTDAYDLLSQKESEFPADFVEEYNNTRGVDRAVVECEQKKVEEERLIYSLRCLAQLYERGLNAQADYHFKLLLIEYDEKHHRISHMPTELKSIPPARQHSIILPWRRVNPSFCIVS